MTVEMGQLANVKAKSRIVCLDEAAYEAEPQIERAPFQPVGAILRHCEEKTSALLFPRRGRVRTAYA